MEKIETIVKTKVKKQTVTTSERQTIVHCKQFLNPLDGVRIWPTTFLIENGTGQKRKLIHAENISMYPTWTIMDKEGDYRFTLIFEGLSKSCISFDLVEEIPQSGAFHVKGIIRNKMDVYNVRII